MRTYKFDSVNTTITTERNHTTYFDNNVRKFSVFALEDDVEMIINRVDSVNAWKVSGLTDTDFASKSDSATRIVETQFNLFIIPKLTNVNFTFDFDIQNISFKSLVSNNVHIYLTIEE